MGKSKEEFSKLGMVVDSLDQMERQRQEQQPTELDLLLDRLRKKEEHLSFSSLKAFSKSPREFINYKLQPKSPPNEGMILGSICDFYLTTPENDFDKEFVVIDKIPTSDNQKGFCEAMLQGESKENAFNAYYKRGSAEAVYDSMKEYIEGHLSGKTICTSAQIDQAQKIVENLKKSDLVMTLLNSCHKFQNKLEWEDNGFKFIGFTDGEGDGLILDAKFIGKGADPDKFERQLRDMKYYLQAAMYCQAAGYEGIPEFYFLVYDKSLNFTVAKLDYSYILYGIKEYEYLLHKLEQCIKENRWTESFNFFDNNSGIRTFYKPGWVKGFETDDEDYE